MPAPIRAFWRQLRDFLRRHTGWAGELVTCVATSCYIISSWWGGADTPLQPSLRLLTEVVDDGVLYLFGLAVCLIQGIGIITMDRWLRWGGAGMQVWIWGSIASAAAISLGPHPIVWMYAGYSALNVYAVLSLLQGDR